MAWRPAATSASSIGGSSGSDGSATSAPSPRPRARTNSSTRLRTVGTRSQLTLHLPEVAARADEALEQRELVAVESSEAADIEVALERRSAAPTLEPGDAEVARADRTDRDDVVSHAYIVTVDFHFVKSEAHFVTMARDEELSARSECKHRAAFAADDGGRRIWEDGPTVTSRAPGPVRRLSLRPLIWLFHLALPVAGLALLLANPMLDMTWEDHVAHFWLVLITAGLSLVLAVFVLAAAQQHADARLYLFALGFVASAGFLGLHAVATPAVVVAKPNAAFILATPIGLVVAAVLSAWASLDMSPERGAAILRHRRLLTGSIVIGMIVWGGLSLVPGSPLLAQLPLTDLQPALRALALVGIALFGYAAIRSYMRYRRRPSVVLLSLITTMVLLAEALLAIAISPNWHLSWWEWHVLMTIGFAYIAYAAHVEYRSEGTLTTLFTAASMEETIPASKLATPRPSTPWSAPWSRPTMGRTVVPQPRKAARQPGRRSPSPG